MSHSDNIRSINICAHVDHGKCEKNGTPVMLVDGTIKLIETLTTQDSVLGMDGKPKKILEIHKGNGMLYKITQKHGNEYIVNANHILVLKFTNVELIYWDTNRNYYRVRYIQNLKIHDKCFSINNKVPLTDALKEEVLDEAKIFMANKKNEPGYNQKGDIIEISVSEYLKLPTNIKKILYGFKQGVEFDVKPILLDPYMLGVWLGDGTSHDPIITNGDNEIIEYIYNYAEKNELQITHTEKYKYKYQITGTDTKKKGCNLFLNNLKDYNLIDNKHIPQDYLYNSRETRLKVLAGILDTDGYMYDNMYEIAQLSDRLANDITQLARSLGFRVNHSKREKTCTKSDGLKVSGLYNIMLISGANINDIPCLVERRKTKLSTANKDFLLSPITVTEDGLGDYTGFQIEGDGKFFAPDFTVKHNSTLTDAFVAKAGLMNEENAGNQRWTDGRDDEKERGITIKSTGVSMKFNYENNDYIVNLIDTPGHCDFNAEVTAALRITDGAIVVVDAVEGVAVQTETVLRQALAEQVKPILLINKLDRYIFELQITPEEAYTRMVNIIEQVNQIVLTYQPKDSELKLELSPMLGNVFMGSGLHGWGFSLKTFAEKLAKKVNMSEEVLMKKLWGENYFDPDPESKKKITTESFKNGKPLERTFCKFVLGPVFQLVNAIMAKNTEKYLPMLKSIGIALSEKDAVKPEKEIYKLVMKQFLPIADSLLYGIVHHLPSPKQAQAYRYITLYDGPLDDECATAIKNCDPNGPLMIYISKMIPVDNSGRFYAFGRIFSGTVSTGQKIRILGSNYKHGTKEELFENKPIQRVAQMIGSKANTCESVECGNTVALVGIDQFVLKACTITTHPEAHPIKTMKFSVSPVVRVSVSPKNMGDLPKLAEGLKKLSKSDPCVQIIITEDEHIIAGVGELHVEICLNDLRAFMKSEINVSKPIVPFRETILAKSSQVCLSKSPNKHNRLYMTAEPLDSDLVVKMLDKEITFKDDVNTRAKILTGEYGWDVNDAKKIWSFGPEGEDESNILVDATKGTQYMNEIRDAVNSGFQWACKEGILCGEPMSGIKYNQIDCTLHADSIHRGASQIIPVTRRVIYASFLTAQPAIMEPIFLVEIQVPDNYVGTIYSCLSQKRGKVISEEKSIGTLNIIKGHLPVAESFGVNGYIREHTSGQAFPNMSFSHWDIVPGNPFDPNTLAGKYVKEVRKRKGLPENIPPLENYLDKL